MKFFYNNTCGVSEKELAQTAEKLLPYLEHLNQVAQQGGYEAQEASINLSPDAALLDRVEALAAKKSGPKLKYIVVAGIGGSNLGTKALYDALFGYFDLLEPARFPKMLFADTNDPKHVGLLGKFLSEKVQNPQEVLVAAISKSGGTTETAANMEILTAGLLKSFPNALERLVAITDDGSNFWQAAQSAGADVLGIPAKVGGRYSVLSAAGLFPLAACGINIAELLAGARQMRELCLNQKPQNNPAALSASILYLNNQKGRSINDNFVFHPELESLGKWYRQLMGESLGKELNQSGEVVHAGLTPTVSVGSTDLHSVGQLYLGGPLDKITTFISAEARPTEPAVPQAQIFSGLVNGIAGKPLSEIMSAILSGVKIAYQKKGLPFMEVILPEISESSLGEFFQFKMLEIMYLGKLLNVNAFDQPNVESYKIETKRILQG